MLTRFVRAFGVDSKSTRSSKKVVLSDVLDVCSKMNINIPEDGHDPLIPVHKAVYPKELTFSEFFKLSIKLDKQTKNSSYDDLQEYESSIVSLKPVSEDLLAKMAESVQSILGYFHSKAGKIDITRDSDEDKELFCLFKL